MLETPASSLVGFPSTPPPVAGRTTASLHPLLHSSLHRTFQEMYTNHITPHNTTYNTRHATHCLNTSDSTFLYYPYSYPRQSSPTPFDLPYHLHHRLDDNLLVNSTSSSRVTAPAQTASLLSTFAERRHRTGATRG